jgi:UDP-glucose 4-epimerase
MIMIAGGSGFFGVNVARCLAERGHEVLLVQRHPIRPPALIESYWQKQVRQAAGDIVDLPFLLGLVKMFPVSSIIHAAHATAGLHNEFPLYQTVRVQIIGMMNCLEAARLMDLRRVTFISSVDLYRGLPAQCEVWHEDAYLPPLSFSDVGNKKRAAEQIGLLYAKTYGMSVASVRVGHNYGPACDWQEENQMITNALAGVAAEYPAIPANRRRHTVYAKDSAEGTCFIHLAGSLKHYIYNLSDGGHPTMEEVREAILEFVPGAEIRLAPPGLEKTEYRPISMERMKGEFGFVPLDVRQGVRAYVDFVKEGKY